MMESLHCLCCFGNHSSYTRYFCLSLSILINTFSKTHFSSISILPSPSVSLVLFFPHHYLPLPSSSRATLFTCWVARLAVVMVTQGRLPCRPEVAVPRLSLCLSLSCLFPSLSSLCTFFSSPFSFCSLPLSLFFLSVIVEAPWLITVQEKIWIKLLMWSLYRPVYQNRSDAFLYFFGLMCHLPVDACVRAVPLSQPWCELAPFLKWN